MRHTLLKGAAIFGLFLVVWQAPAHAQATPQQIQAQIANGQAQTAIGELNNVLQSHPNSGVAWYLTAEAQDALGHEDAARTALAKAQQLAPGLPFAKPAEVANLQAHLNAPAPQSHGFGVSPMIIIAGLVILFLVARMFRRRRMQMNYPAAYNQPGAPYPYTPPGGGMGFGQGGGLGSSLLGGLAAGAGFAAGERIIDDIAGRDFGGRGNDPGPNIDPVPDRDDGLNGSPGWDSGSTDSTDNSGGFDSNNSW